MAEQSRTKVELSAELDRARARIARNFDALRVDLDVPRHVKSSFGRNKAAFIGSATVLGLLLSKLPPRKKKIYVDRQAGSKVQEAEKAGLTLMLLQFAMNAAKPALISLATKKISDFAKSRPSSPDAPL